MYTPTVIATLEASTTVIATLEASIEHMEKKAVDLRSKTGNMGKMADESKGTIEKHIGR